MALGIDDSQFLCRSFGDIGKATIQTEDDASGCAAHSEGARHCALGNIDDTDIVAILPPFL